MRGKREWLCRVGEAVGAWSWLRALPPRRGLVVLNYHRIGNGNDHAFDDGVFSCSQEDLRSQIGWLERNWRILSLQELLEIRRDGFRFKDPSVMITFDDGYKDNIDLALPILVEANVPGVFFVQTRNLIDPTVMWWDRIAYLVRRTEEHQITLPMWGNESLGLEDKPAVIARILRFYKSLPEGHGSFLRDLQERLCVEADWRDLAEGLFMNSEDLKKLVHCGQSVGSHTHSHRILSRLSYDEQEKELNESRRLLEECIGEHVLSVSYPVGSSDSFSNTTRALAIKSGYHVGFSFYGGYNKYGIGDPMDIRRSSADQRDQLGLLKASVVIPHHLRCEWP